jgi:tyrosinase
MLRIYADAVKAMKALSPRDGRSWTFQWYIHATPIATAQAITAVFGNTTGPARDLAAIAWYTCQAHLGQPEDYFLPWHRLYVSFLEEIVRSITGHHEFTLPYWDYTNSTSNAIPVEFQNRFAKDPRFSVLYVKNRNTDDGRMFADVNAGEPLNKYFTGAENFLTLPDLGQSNYSLFCSELDANLHGDIHVFTGDSNNMGRVPTAARDPIFWLHHCNIDRIWAAWNANGGTNPTQTNGKNWSDTKFTFVNASGAAVEIAISAMADPSALPYRYDELPGVPPALRVAAGGVPTTTMLLLRSVTPRVAPATSATAPATSAAVPAPLALGAATQTVRLVPTAPQNSLMAAAPKLQRGTLSRLILTLKDLRAATDPNTVYRVYLDLPPNADKEVAEQHYVGLLNFFGAATATEHATPAGKTTHFDVTAVVGRLNLKNALQNETTVTLAPVGPPADGSVPVIFGGIELEGR